MSKKEDKNMAMPQEKLMTNDALRKQLIRKASKRINEKYDKALKLISKN